MTTNPRDRYKADGFPEQSSKSPALQSEMTSLPDCGEQSYQGQQRLSGRKALITGGDSGIGRAVAIAFVREGAQVCVQYLPGEEEDAESLQDLLSQDGYSIEIIAADFCQPGEGRRVVKEAFTVLGHLDILVLNAAQQFAVASLSDLSLAQVEQTFQVNFFTMIEMIKEAEPNLAPGASIITTSSVQAFNPSTQLLDYAATKAAISNLTINLSQYFAEKGIRVNGVAPGPIWTPLQLDAGQLPGALKDFGQNSLLGRAGQPVELADVYVFLASEQASYVTGQIYGVTGGQNINL